MSEFWDEMFRKIGSVWSFEPTDSALQTSDLFASEKIVNVLIPGIGFGRNAKPFFEKGMDVTGIEISETAIRLARENGLKIPIHHGSVAEMPFDDSVSIEREFGRLGLVEYREIEEPVKHMPNEDPMKFWMVVCRKTVNSH